MSSVTRADTASAALLKKCIQVLSHGEISLDEKIERMKMGDRSAMADVTTGPPSVNDAAVAVGLLGDETAVPFLVSRLQKEKRAAVRAKIVRSLGWINSQTAAPALEAALHDLFPPVQLEAKVALKKLEEAKSGPSRTNPGKTEPGYASAEAMLQRCGKILIYTKKAGFDMPLKEDAVIGLGMLGDEKAVPLLIDHLKNDPDPDLRVLITTALGRIGSKSAVPALKEALVGDPYIHARIGAARALTTITGKTYRAADSFTPPVAKKKPDIFIQPSRAFDDDTMLTKCFIILDQGDDRFRFCYPAKVDAITTLGLLGNKSAVPVLVDHLQKEKDRVQDRDLRRHIVTSLGWIGDKSAIPALEAAALHDPDKSVQKLAALALNKITGQKPTANSTDVAKPDETDSGAGTLLTRCAKILVYNEVSAFDKPSKVNAFIALGLLGDEAAIPMLSDYLQNDENDELRVQITKALTWINKPAAIPVLEQALHDPDLHVRILSSIGLWSLTGKNYEYDHTHSAGEAEAHAYVQALLKARREGKPLMEAVRENSPLLRNSLPPALERPPEAKPAPSDH
jgi:HEAT repeat protein